ncbi:MAG: peptide chain release factor N(5)-glutamine methyltransferase [Campylobacterales bacterium]|nr:peptide chain release factor N(5)-glutamine methyltransferase [Campylobacterales bacterium]
MAERTIAQLQSEATTALQGVVDAPRREAQRLLEAFLGCDALYLLAHADERVEEAERFLGWVERRSRDEPLEYIVATVSFYSQNFYIDAGALIPRPETELLIDEVLKRVHADADVLVCEVGIGSGVISIVLAQHLRKARFIGVDISEAALHVAKENVRRFGLEDRIELRLGHLLDPVSESIDLLVSNPPYIAEDAPLERTLSYEPQNALFGGVVGDELIGELCRITCKRQIKMFACEMGYDQQEKVRTHWRSCGYASLEFYKDYAGFDRGFVVQLKEK